MPLILPSPNSSNTSEQTPAINKPQLKFSLAQETILIKNVNPLPLGPRNVHVIMYNMLHSLPCATRLIPNWQIIHS